MVLKRQKVCVNLQIKNPGGQVGHQGSTLKMVKDPDHVVTHHPKTCRGCGCCLENVEPQKNDSTSSF